MDWMNWIAVLIGHIGLWCFIFNRTHATAWPRTWRKLIEKAVNLIVFLPLGAVSLNLWQAVDPSLNAIAGNNGSVLAYFYLCFAAAIWFAGTWLFRIVTVRTPSKVSHRRRTILNVELNLGRRLTAGRFANLLRLIPGNRCCWIEIAEGEIEVGAIQAGLDGLKIAHLSDFHFTGGIQAEYFKFGGLSESAVGRLCVGHIQLVCEHLPELRLKLGLGVCRKFAFARKSVRRAGITDSRLHDRLSAAWPKQAFH